MEWTGEELERRVAHACRAIPEVAAILAPAELATERRLWGICDGAFEALRERLEFELRAALGMRDLEVVASASGARDLELLCARKIVYARTPWIRVELLSQTVLFAWRGQGLAEDVAGSLDELRTARVHAERAKGWKPPADDSLSRRLNELEQAPRFLEELGRSPDTAEPFDPVALAMDQSVHALRGLATEALAIVFAVLGREGCPSVAAAVAQLWTDASVPESVRKGLERWLLRANDPYRPRRTLFRYRRDDLGELGAFATEFAEWARQFCTEGGPDANGGSSPLDPPLPGPKSGQGEPVSIELPIPRRRPD